MLVVSIWLQRGDLRGLHRLRVLGELCGGDIHIAVDEAVDFQRRTRHRLEGRGEFAGAFRRLVEELLALRVRGLALRLRQRRGELGEPVADGIDELLVGHGDEAHRVELRQRQALLDVADQRRRPQILVGQRRDARFRQALPRREARRVHRFGQDLLAFNAQLLHVVELGDVIAVEPVHPLQHLALLGGRRGLLRLGEILLHRLFQLFHAAQRRVVPGAGIDRHVMAEIHDIAVDLEHAHRVVADPREAVEADPGAVEAERRDQRHDPEQDENKNKAGKDAGADLEPVHDRGASSPAPRRAPRR